LNWDDAVVNADSQKSAQPLDLIVIEDSAVDLELEVDALREAGFAVEVRQVEGEAAFHAALDRKLPAAILSDWTLPDFSGRRALEIARERCPDVPFIFVSGTISETAALDALRQGAIDYVFKHQLQQLGPALFRALDEASSLRALQDARWRLGSIIEGTHAGTWEWNVQTGETVFNERWAQIVGYTLDELKPQSASGHGGTLPTPTTCNAPPNCSSGTLPANWITTNANAGCGTRTGVGSGCWTADGQ
jgi:CheY-like chemotaxis protein